MQKNLLFNHKLRNFENLMVEYESESLFLPNQHEKRKHEKLEKKTSKQKLRQKTTYNKGMWSYKENLAYKQFLERNLDLFQKTLKVRKAIKIHVLMSSFLKTRSSTQCRSHHQKMLKYYGNELSIISFIQSLKGVQHLNMIEVNNQISVPTVSTPQYNELQEVNQSGQPPLTLWQSLVSIDEEENRWFV